MRLWFVLLGNVCVVSRFLQHPESWSPSFPAPRAAPSSSWAGAVGSWAQEPPGRNCHSPGASWSFQDLKSLFNFRIWKENINSQSPPVLFTWEHKIPPGHSQELFHSREMHLLIQPEMTFGFSFPSRRGSEPKNWFFLPSPCSPSLKAQIRGSCCNSS